MTAALALISEAFPHASRVLSFRGSEALGALYEFRVYVLVEDASFDPEPAIGAKATLRLDPAPERAYRYHGILAAVEGVAELAGGSAVYAVTLSPRLSRLSLTEHSRVFVDQSLPSILEAVLKLEGVEAREYELRLSGTYPIHPHVCQYRESSLAFLSRRMEREGVYWYFEHGDDAEKLVITDDRAYHPLAEEPVRFALAEGRAAPAAPGFLRFNSKHASVPGRVELRGYDYLRPTLPVHGAATIPGGAGVLHMHDEHFTTPEEGARLAGLRAEELTAKRKTFHGTGSVYGLRAGAGFKLEDHPRLDGEYLTTAIAHSGNHIGDYGAARQALGDDAGADGYHVEVTAIPKSTQYRPARVTPVPRIYGTERAVVDGEAQSQYAQLDDHGRYLVRMHFDENDSRAGKSSTRIRMMQAHGGGTEAMHFPLRKGTEVVITFDGGDPDRPVIAGVVPNVLQPSPVSAKNATKNVLQTGGGNKLVIEDEEGKQYIHLRSSHKSTYLHLGAPFNPSYTKTSSTDGTSMSYTRDISTSVTGSDAQTLVEDSRITIIGRSRISAGDARGAEIVKLVGPAFIDRDGLDPIYGEIASDVKQAVSDAAALAAAVAKLNAQLAKETADPMSFDGRSAAAAVQSASKTLLADLNTLLDDADRYQTYINKNKLTDSDAGAWHDAVLGALQHLNDANNTVNPDADKSANPPNKPLVPTNRADGATILGAFTTGTAPATPVPLSTLFTQNLPLALATDGNLVAIKGGAPPVPQSPTWTTPNLPNPSAVPTYIAISHPHSQLTTMSGGLDSSGNPVAPVSIDDWIEQQATASPPVPQIDEHDTTAIDQLPLDPPAFDGSVTNPNPPAPKLHDGSDVKIVGGDTVTFVAHDTRSQVHGHTYSLVFGAATSVLYSPHIAADVKSNGWSALIVRPASDFAPTDDDKTWAQFSTTYGHTFSWVDGKTEARVTSGTHSVVYCPANRPLNPLIQGWHSPTGLPTDVRPSPPPIPTPATDDKVAQSSELYGDQYTWLTGEQNTTINGDKTTTVNGDQTTTINGNQTTNAETQQTYVENSFKIATASEDITWALKFGFCLGLNVSINTASASFNMMKFDYTMVKLANKSIDIGQKQLTIDSHGVHVTWAGLHTFG